MTNPIGNVSGTAFWIAQFRAMETARPNPLFRDPWAAELAGKRGAEIMQTLRGSHRIVWSITARTLLLDEYVLGGIAEHGFDTVVNLGAGLDTRAYRLRLPRKLRWFDVDHAEIIEHKRHVLRNAEPSCVYRPVVADLSDDGARQQVLSDIARDSRKTLVITEGLLEYLGPESVLTLARELHGRPQFHSWLCNLFSPPADKHLRRWQRRLEDVNAPITFIPRDSSAFFEDAGWRESAWGSLVDVALARKLIPLYLLPGFYAARFAPHRWREHFSRMMGVARLERIQLESARSCPRGEGSARAGNPAE